MPIIEVFDKGPNIEESIKNHDHSARNVSIPSILLKGTCYTWGDCQADRSWGPEKDDCA